MNPFTTALVKAPKRGRFDFSHSNALGMRIGVLTPTLTEFIIPGDEVSISLEQICRMAPMPVPTFTPLKVRHDFFFVPLRLLYGNDYMDKLFGAASSGRVRAGLADLSMIFKMLTPFNWDAPSEQFEYVGSGRSTDGCKYPVAGTLLDFLGYPVLTDRNGGLNSELLAWISADSVDDFVNIFKTLPQVFDALQSTPSISIEKLFAYHFIWRDWYRFTGIQNDVIVEPFILNGILSTWRPDSNYTCTEYIDAYYPDFLEQGANRLRFADLGLLKMAHLTKDMFMSARYGAKPTVLIPTGENGTIPALREASAIQRFLDLISITGQRYFDKARALFGVIPEGPKDDRVQFLARYQQFLKVGEVLTTATTSEAQTGDYSGRGILIDGRYLFKRRFTEHGYLFCISSVIPEVSYSGLGRDLTDVNVLDTPIPSLAEVGDQTIFGREVAFDFGVRGPQRQNDNNRSFGDQFRYYAYKSHNNEVHGFFLMDTATPWTGLLPIDSLGAQYYNEQNMNVIGSSKVYPARWNRLFNDVSDEYIFGDRLFFNLDFNQYITRALPKYINYHL